MVATLKVNYQSFFFSKVKAVKSNCVYLFCVPYCDGCN